MVWYAWIIVAIVLVVVEMLTLDLVLLMLAGGSLATALAAALGVDDFIWQAVIWGVVSLLFLLTLRRWMLKKLRLREKLPETNVHALAGKPGVTLTEVTPEGGRIKFSGEVWTARTDGPTAIAQNTPVVVIAIDGATAVVALATAKK